MKPPRASVLIAEDEPAARNALCELLRDDGYHVIPAADGREALHLIAQGKVEAALVDVRMPDIDGLQVLRVAKEQPNSPAVLVMTAYGNSAVAIEAMKLGAYDYIVKPINFAEVSILLDRAIAARRQAMDLEGYRLERASSEAELVGDSAAMQQVYKLVGQVAPIDSTVLIRGESGTGKELVARAIHAHSPRRDRRMVRVSCAAIPETMLEAELFGYEKGAFTGAIQRRIGKLEFAGGGTVLLDEIGELSMSTQAKLLRVLQERTIERLGSNHTIGLDIRIIAATNRDLEAAIRAGTFREDLYYRLNVFVITLPPLRERTVDIPELARSLLSRAAERLNRPKPLLTSSAISALQELDWPGNVRELEHSIERALILSRGGAIGPEAFEEKTSSPASTDVFSAVPLELGFHMAITRLERSLIDRALRAANGNRSRAAELLGINRRLLYDKIREFNL